MEAKDTSLIGMVVGAICLFIAFGVCTYKLIVNDFTLTMDQALAYITMGAAVGIPFCPIYISTWLDKIAQIKHGPVVEVDKIAQIKHEPVVEVGDDDAQ